MRQDRLFGSDQSKSSRFLAVHFWVLQLKRLHVMKGVAHCGFAMIAEPESLSHNCVTTRSWMATSRPLYRWSSSDDGVV